MKWLCRGCVRIRWGKFFTPCPNCCGYTTEARAKELRGAR